MKTSEIKEKWQSFKTQKGYLQRLDPNHPMDFFIGISDKGNDELVLFTLVEPMQMKSSKAIDIEKKVRKDGKWATQIESLVAENQDVFAKLCIDLVESSQYVKSEEEGLKCIVKRFIKWQSLFATIHEILPSSVLKGMVGELSFASEVLSKHYSWDEIMEAWQGPDGADRDYTFTNYWFEVKAINTGKEVVTISSLNQLENDNQGYLVKYNVDESSKTDPKAISMNAFIDSIRDKLGAAQVASQKFEQKLVSLGYLSQKAYDDVYFVHAGPEFYSVDSAFPRLVTKNVPPEIVKAQYDLSLAGIDHTKVIEEEIWS